MKGTFNHRGSIPALALVGVVAVAGVAYAAIPSADGVIHSCYNASSNPSGQLRVIDTEAGGKCAKNEKALDFNQKGPKGDKGDKGDPCLPSNPACVGPQGIPGADGADGNDGAPGADGQDGAPGADGAKGDKGDPGAPGTPGISTVTFAFGSSDYLDDTPAKVASKTLAAGSWAVVATVNSSSGFYFAGGDHNADMGCELRNGADVIGHATDRRVYPEGATVKRSLSMNGGAFIPAGGGEVSLWCTSQGIDYVADAQIMMMKVGGFS
jgi:hypothetical protein